MSKIECIDNKVYIEDMLSKCDVSIKRLDFMQIEEYFSSYLCSRLYYPTDIDVELDFSKYSANDIDAIYNRIIDIIKLEKYNELYCSKSGSTISIFNTERDIIKMPKHIYSMNNVIVNRINNKLNTLLFALIGILMTKNYK